MRLTDAPSAAGSVATGSAAAGNIALVSESVTVTQFTDLAGPFVPFFLAQLLQIPCLQEPTHSLTG